MPPSFVAKASNSWNILWDTMLHGSWNSFVLSIWLLSCSGYVGTKGAVSYFSHLIHLVLWRAPLLQCRTEPHACLASQFQPHGKRIVRPALGICSSIPNTYAGAVWPVQKLSRKGRLWNAAPWPPWPPRKGSKFSVCTEQKVALLINDVSVIGAGPSPSSLLAGLRGHPRSQQWKALFLFDKQGLFLSGVSGPLV